jgi:uncharacterized membrane protein YfcA
MNEIIILLVAFLVISELLAPAGFHSGWMGVGGEIFLTTLLVICGRADVKTAAADSAP